jgi:hypothetical protein
MKMIVKAYQGSNGMNVTSTNTEMVAFRIPSQRGHAAPEKPIRQPDQRTLTVIGNAYGLSTSPTLRPSPGSVFNVPSRTKSRIC